MRSGHWVVLCGLAVLCRCTEPGRPADNGCTYTSDCNAGESCIGGSCLPISKPPTSSCGEGCTVEMQPECTQDRECSPGTVCENERCVPGCQTPGTSIACSGELTCDPMSGRCVETGGCRVDFDCAPPAGICGDGGECVAGCLTTGCRSGELCNGQTGRCEPESVGQACTSDGECAPPTTVCESGGCKPGCGLANGATCGQLELCDSETGRCVPRPECATDLDCFAPTPSCDLATGTCYGCQSDVSCSGATPVCNLQLGTCVGCVASSDCPSSQPVCDPGSATCRGCTANAECGGAAPVCHLPSGVCVGCVSNADCGPPAPVCDVASGSCGGCTSSAQCGGSTPTCHIPSGICLECVSNADCPSTAPTCNPSTGTCELSPPQPLGAACGSDAECESEVCWDLGAGGRCVRSCNAPVDCDNGTTCYMFSGARLCLLPQDAPASAEDIACTIDADCSGGNQCVWFEETTGRWDQRCLPPIGTGQPQTQCSGGNDCQNGVCTLAVNGSGSGFCRYTCAADFDCPNNFACVYIDYSTQSFVQAVKACLPVESPDPPICGTDFDCFTTERCKILDAGTQGSLHYLANACLPR